MKNDWTRDAAIEEEGEKKRMVYFQQQSKLFGQEELQGAGKSAVALNVTSG